MAAFTLPAGGSTAQDGTMQYCRYIMTMDITGSNLWRVPLVSGHPVGMDYGSNGNLIISENSTTYLVNVGKTVQKLQKPFSIAQTDAGPCKFHPHNNRWVPSWGLASYLHRASSHSMESRLVIGG